MVFSLGLTGCKKENKKTESKKTIKLATFYSDKDNAAIYKEIAKEYEKTNPDVKVEIISDYGDDEKVRNSLSQEGDVDIIGLRRTQVIEYAKSGLINDLTPFVTEKNLTNKLYGVSLAYGKYNGKIYGIGDMPYTIEWFYNVDMFQKYGINEPRTAEELAAICTKLKSKGVKTPMVVGAMDGWPLTTIFGTVTAQTVDINELTSNMGSDSKAFENIKGMKEAFTTFGKFSSACIPANSTDINYRASVDEFVKGKAAILPAGAWATELIAQIKSSGFNYQVFENPITAVDSPMSKFSATAGQVLAIPAKSKNTKEAEKFLEFILSEDAQKYFVEKGRISSLITSNRAENLLKQRVLSHLQLTGDNSVMLMDNLESSMAENTTRILQDVIEGRVKPADAWSRILKITFMQ